MSAKDDLAMVIAQEEALVFERFDEDTAFELGRLVREAATALGKGVAVLPEYFVSKDLETRQLIRILPRLRLLSDFFRLVFRVDDPRRNLYVRLGEQMRAESLQ